MLPIYPAHNHIQLVLLAPLAPEVLPPVLLLVAQA
jgi:hypothetical protein